MSPQFSYPICTPKIIRQDVRSMDHVQSHDWELYYQCRVSISLLVSQRNAQGFRHARCPDHVDQNTSGPLRFPVLIKADKPEAARKISQLLAGITCDPVQPDLPQLIRDIDLRQSKGGERPWFAVSCHTMHVITNNLK